MNPKLQKIRAVRRKQIEELKQREQAPKGWQPAKVEIEGKEEALLEDIKDAERAEESK